MASSIRMAFCFRLSCKANLKFQQALPSSALPEPLHHTWSQSTGLLGSPAVRSESLAEPRPSKAYSPRTCETDQLRSGTCKTHPRSYDVSGFHAVSVCSTCSSEPRQLQSSLSCNNALVAYTTEHAARCTPVNIPWPWPVMIKENCRDDCDGDLGKSQKLQLMLAPVSQESCPPAKVVESQALKKPAG